MISRKLFQNSRNLFLGGFGSQLIALAALPLIARIYSPTHLGIVATWAFVCGFFQLVSSLRLEYSIIRSNSSDHAISILRKLLVLSPILSVLTGTLASWAVVDSVSANFWVLCVLFSANIYFGAAYQLYLGFSLREGNTNIQMRALLLQVSTGILGQLILGYINPSPISFLWGTNIGLLMGTAYVWFKHRGSFQRKQKSIGIRELIKTHSSDIKYGIVHSCLAIAGRGFPAPFIVFLGFPGFAGQFVIVQKILTNPMFVISNAVGRALMHEIGTNKKLANNNGNFTRLLFNFHYLCFLCSLFFASISEKILITVLGDEWGLAARLSSILVIATPSLFIYELVVARLVAKDDQRSITVVRTFQMLSGLVALSLLKTNIEPEYVFIIFTFALVLNSAIGICISDQISKASIFLGIIVVILGSLPLAVRLISNFGFNVLEDTVNHIFAAASILLGIYYAFHLFVFSDFLSRIRKI